MPGYCRHSKTEANHREKKKGRVNGCTRCLHSARGNCAGRTYLYRYMGAVSFRGDCVVRYHSLWSGRREQKIAFDGATGCRIESLLALVVTFVTCRFREAALLIHFGRSDNAKMLSRCLTFYDFVSHYNTRRCVNIELMIEGRLSDNYDERDLQCCNQSMSVLNIVWENIF